jgi:hypothetical protein
VSIYIYDDGTWDFDAPGKTGTGKWEVVILRKDAVNDMWGSSAAELRGYLEKGDGTVCLASEELESLAWVAGSQAADEELRRLCSAIQPILAAYCSKATEISEQQITAAWGAYDAAGRFLSVLGGVGRDVEPGGGETA